MSNIAKWWLLASALLCVAGALVHLAIPLGGPGWYWYWGAPQGLVAMASAGLARPVVTCVIIASILFVFAAYAISALGLMRRLPAVRLVLGIIGLGLAAHGVWLPIAAAKDPVALATTCGRCGSPNGFVFAMAALCFFIGVGFILGALHQNLTIRSTGRKPAARVRAGYLKR